jgi:hypothetical protein
MNKNIRRTDDLIRKLRDERDAFAVLARHAEGSTVLAESGHDPMEVLDRLDHEIAEGEAHREFWVDATHGDYPRDASAALAIKRDWNAWTRTALSLWVMFERRRMIDRW